MLMSIGVLYVMYSMYIHIYVCTQMLMLSCATYVYIHTYICAHVRTCTYIHLYLLFSQNWHKRFFCYRTTKMLEYYKVESDVGQKPKGFINLEDCVAINAGLVHKKYKHVFSIELKDRTYYLVASCRAEMQDWVDLLCASVFGGKDGRLTGAVWMYVRVYICHAYICTYVDTLCCLVVS